MVVIFLLMANVCFREDGVMLLDGEPFFPLGVAYFPGARSLYELYSVTQACETLKACGFNMVNLYTACHPYNANGYEMHKILSGPMEIKEYRMDPNDGVIRSIYVEPTFDWIDTLEQYGIYLISDDSPFLPDFYGRGYPGPHWLDTKTLLPLSHDSIVKIKCSWLRNILDNAAWRKSFIGYMNYQELVWNITGWLLYGDTIKNLRPDYDYSWMSDWPPETVITDTDTMIFICWHFERNYNDEMLEKRYNDIKEMYGTVKKWDPNHIVIMRFACAHPMMVNSGVSFDSAMKHVYRDWAKYSEAADVISINIYPANWRHLERMWKGNPNFHYLRQIKTFINMLKRVAPNKPIWIELEATCFDNFRLKYNEARFEAYDAIINGAKGLWWFSWVNRAHYSSWKVVKKLVRNELRYLTNVFTAQDIPYPIESVPPVDLMTKSHKGYRYLFAANASDTLKVVKFLPIFQFYEDSSFNFKDIKIEVMFENRILNVDSVIEDTFEPWEVHVYKWQMLLLYPPTSLTAKVFSQPESVKVLLEWEDNSNCEEGYILQVKDENSDWQILDTVKENTTTYELTLPECKRYYFRIFAYSGNVHSDYSNIVAIWTPLLCPSNFMADALNYEQIELKWEDNSNYEDNYIVLWRKENDVTWNSVVLPADAVNCTISAQPYKKYQFKLYCFKKVIIEPDPYYIIASDTVYAVEYSIPIWSDNQRALFANNNRKFDPSQPVLMFTKQGKIWLSQNLNAPFREEPLQNGRCPACVSQYSYAWIETKGNKEYIKIKTYYPDEIRAVDTITINTYPRKYFSTPSMWFTDRPYLTVEKLSVPLTGGRSWSLIYIDCTKLPADVYGASGAPGTYLYNYRKYKIASREEIGIVEIDTGHYIASPSIVVKDSFVFIAFSVNDSLFLTRIRKMPWNRFMSFRVCDSIVIDTIMFVSKGEHPSMDISSSGDLWLSWVKDDTIYWALIEPVYQSASTSSYTLAYIPPQPDDIAPPEPEPEPEPEYTPAFIIHRLENLPSYSSNFPQILAEKGLVWMQKEGGIWRIKLAKWDAGSENWETPQTVSGDTNCYHPQIGIKDDEIYVAYTRGDKAPYEIKFYSTEEIPAPSPSPPEKPSHCPILATFVDSIYIVENNILNPFRDYFIDFYPIRFSPSAVSGKYKFTIFEGHRDRVYLDGVALIVVEHPESVKIGLTSSGRIFGYDKISHPLFCYNQCGQSVLSLVKYADGWRYRGDEKDVLFVCFDISGMGEDIAIRFTNQLKAPSRPPEYPEIPPEEIPSPEVIKKEIEAGNIVIFPEDAPYQCERVMEAYPPVQFEVMAEGEIFYQREIPAPHYLLIHVPQGQSGYLWLRVNYPCAFALDEIVACNVTENITPTLIYPQSARHSIEGEMKDKLCDTNRTFVQLRIGERLDIEFDTIPHTQKLSFIFVSAGYYRQEFPPLCRVRYVKENLQNMEVDMRCVRNKLNRAIKELVFAESTFSDSWHCVNRTFIRINKSVLKMKEAARLLKIRGKSRNGEIDSLRSWSFLLAEACDLLTLQKMREVNLTNTVRDSLVRLAIKAIKKGRDYYNTPAPDMQILGIEWYCYNLAITGFHTAYVLLSAMEHVCRGGVQSKFDFDKVKFRMMPNPVRDYLTVRYYLPDKIKVRFRIYDVTGRVVEEKSLYDAGDGIIKMRVKHLPQGVYFLHIDAESQKLIKKFVKIH